MTGTPRDDDDLIPFDRADDDDLIPFDRTDDGTAVPPDGGRRAATAQDGPDGTAQAARPDPAPEHPAAGPSSQGEPRPTAQGQPPEQGGDTARDQPPVPDQTARQGGNAARGHDATQGGDATRGRDARQGEDAVQGQDAVRAGGGGQEEPGVRRRSAAASRPEASEAASAQADPGWPAREEAAAPRGSHPAPDAAGSSSAAGGGASAASHSASDEPGGAMESQPASDEAGAAAGSSSASGGGDGGPGSRSASPEAGAGASGGGDGGAGECPGSGGGSGERVGEGGRRRRALRRAGVVTAGLAVVLVALGAGAFVVLKPRLSPDDFEGRGSGAVTVRIPAGASTEDIGAALAKAGVVASVRSFVNATQDRGATDRLRPGHYRLRKGMAAKAALDLLLTPSARVVTRVTVPEGMRASEALQRLSAQTGIPLKDFQSVAADRLGLPPYARGVEGFLFPATYEVEPGGTAVDVLSAMVSRFKAAARSLNLEERAARVHLTPLQAVTVASIAEAEGGTEEDFPKITRVIYNRLQSGMPLQIDATVTYAQGRRTLKVTERDTKVDSPYNTYTRKGLPPGPISNPGEKALLAALEPAQGDWHWFVTTDPAHRITKFTNKESEFVRYREELNKNLGTR